MALRLRIIGAHAAVLGDTVSTVFGVHGGTIGRATDNDWVLPDPDRFLSGHHARVEYREGQYWLADTSSNGTYLNDGDEPLSASGPYALKDGDRLRMGDFEMAVTIDPNNDFPPDKSAIVAGLGSSSAIRRTTEEHLNADLDVEALLKVESSGARVTPVNAWGLAVESAAVIPARTPKPTKGTETAPAAKEPSPAPSGEQASWHLSTRRVEPYRNPMRSTEAAGVRSTADSSAADDGPRSTGSGLQALSRGAGIDLGTLPTAVQDQALHLAGQLLREMVLGMMDVLQTRAEVKNRFRVADPSIQSLEKEHNPLQFSASVDEALRKLFEAHGRTGSRYLAPVEAVRETFQDLKLHHQAVMSAMQTAFMEFLARLDPQELRERFDRGLKRGGLLGAATNKMKYWELYSEFYQTLSQKQELPHLFVEEFAQAYAAKVNEIGAKKGRSAKNS